MRTVVIDGKNVLVYLEMCSSGMVVSTLVPEADGTFSAYREWFDNPKMAQSIYDNRTDEEVGVKAAQAPLVSGKNVPA